MVPSYPGFSENQSSPRRSPRGQQDRETYPEAYPARRDPLPEEQVYQFLKEIFTRFGVPRVLVTDNGTQFTAGKIEDLCLELNIEHRTASISYPQANG
ncbi:hypothetical protein LIER_05928 [Lithospermum erythrorhizon]|uniref:Integrase catalytic domain-containing protein n=1 Tax=Lithospermum erythrorhizon TaxID=34254 RepID=A0AAV3P2B6_LITER